MRVFDIHTHPILRREGCGQAAVRRLIRESRELGITRMNILGDVAHNGPCQTAEQVTFINEESARLQAEHPDFFTFFCYLNPTLGEKAVMSEVERCVTQHRAKGIKLEAANHAADPCMSHVAKAARTFDIVVLQHSWSTDTNKLSKGPKVQTDPDHTALFARRNPDVKIIMAHLYGCGHRGVIAVKTLPNVWVDTSGAYPIDGILEYAVEHLGAERVLYGSDIPIRESRVKIGHVLGARISAADKNKILYDNAAKLLGLT
jgi:uncharacterized protein